ncbi:unnamed protein product [Brassica oleracea var. botrytis]|uniref:BnaC03g66300D protein n=2 Tax=Brassica napus TaxID=3708 RepID=A0A078GSZ9_BRANA|nr:hypothetical protein HID58_057112 [Brassica napus]CAF1711561.1 unnamed protein product [Brassica napus]CDY28329.1 BnaC03g66300D [Brassica napus]
MNALENKQQLKTKHENKLAQDVIVQDTIVLATTLEFDAFILGAKKNAVAWVQDAVVTGFSQFNLFKEPGKQEDTTAHQDHHHYIVIHNTSEKLNPKENTTSARNQAYKGVKQASKKHSSVSEISNFEGKNRLKESLSLAEELLRVSSPWFFKYLENSLKKGSFFVKKEEANGKESILISLKAVNCWLHDLIKNRCEASEKVEELRKKLHQFLLKRIEYTIGETM